MEAMVKNKIENVGKFAGVPYDWRAPTKARFKSRVWNPDAPFINPRWWGWGYDFNFYAILHPVKSRRNRRNGGRR
jgi:hypothetical protein